MRVLERVGGWEELRSARTLITGCVHNETCRTSVGCSQRQQATAHRLLQRQAGTVVRAASTVRGCWARFPAERHDICAFANTVRDGRSTYGAAEARRA